MDIHVPKDKCITEEMIKRTLSMLDETVSKLMHKDKDGDRYGKREHSALLPIRQVKIFGKIKNVSFAGTRHLPFT